MYFGLYQKIPVFTSKGEERNAQLKRCSSLTLREIISDGKLKSEDRKLIRKPVFFFRNSVDVNSDDLFDGNYK